MPNSTDAAQTNNSNTLTLQSMGVGEILDITFSFYREHFLLFLGIITAYFLGCLVTYSLEGFFQDSDLKILVPHLVNMPFALLSIGGIIVATAALYLGKQITSTDALKQTSRQFWYLLGAYLLWTTIILGNSDHRYPSFFYTFYNARDIFGINLVHSICLFAFLNLFCGTLGFRRRSRSARKN